jgi:hypothetical protein
MLHPCPKGFLTLKGTALHKDTPSDNRSAYGTYDFPTAALAR